jgi:hypothetical protein
MLEMYKCLHASYKIQHPVSRKATTTEFRGNSLNLQKIRHRLKIRGNYFSEWIVSMWNSLPDTVVSAPLVNAFENAWTITGETYHARLLEFDILTVKTCNTCIGFESLFIILLER